MHVSGTGFGYSDISFKNCRNHSTSSPVLSKIINSDSIVERAMQVCLKYFQDIAALPRVNTYPLVDFDSSKSAIQIVSLYLQVQVDTFHISKHFFWYSSSSLLLIVGQSNNHHQDYQCIYSICLRGKLYRVQSKYIRLLMI